MKRLVMIILSLAIIGLTNKAYAAGAVPYSDAATYKLSNSLKSMGTFAPPVGATKSEQIRALYNYYSKVFTKAGYSFEKSIIQVSNDLKKDPDFCMNYPYVMTPAILVYNLSLTINLGRSDVKIKSSFDKSVSKQTVIALDNILANFQQREATKKAEELKKYQIHQAEQDKLQKEEENERIARIKADEEEAKHQKDLEVIEKQAVLKILNGHFENERGGTTIGTIDIKVDSDDKATFSIYNKLDSIACKIDNAEASIGYAQYGLVQLIFGKQTECEITMTLFESSPDAKEKYGYDNYIEVDQVGCKKYCGRVGTMLGRYKKFNSH